MKYEDAISVFSSSRLTHEVMYGYHVFMTTGAVTEKIERIEAELRLLKVAVARRPDILVDENNWKKARPTMKKIRTKLYKERYA